eukprot:126325_1
MNLSSKDEINCCEFDTNFDNVMIIKNSNTLQKRAVNNINVVQKSITLNEKINRSASKLFSLSNCGNFCIVASGGGKKYAYFIDIENEVQSRLESGKMERGVYAPCFINGEAKFIAIGDYVGNIEIWDVVKKEMVKTWKVDACIKCTTSRNNILAVSSGAYEKNNMLRLYDVRNWGMFYSQKHEMSPKSLHLTSDSKYVTIAGIENEQCLVFQIQ